MQYMVVVIGRNYTSRLGMIRAVGRAGYDVIVIKTNGTPNSKDIDAYSKYVKAYLYAKEPDREELIKVILSLKSKKEKKILVPVDDYAASTIDDNIDLLKTDFLFPNILMKQGAINRLMDKKIQKELAQKKGLNVAEGWCVDIKNCTYSLPTDIVYPVFPKPQISFKGNKRCMKKCNNETELRRLLDDVARQRNCPMLLEQYIRIDKEYAILGVSNGYDVVMPATIQMLESGKGAHRGVTLQGKIINSNAHLDFINKLKEFIRDSHFIGLFDIDFYESNGTLYFNELNLRFGASGYAITSSGINLPLLFIDYIQGGKWADNDKRPNDSEFIFVNEKVAYDDYYNGYLSKKEYNKLISQADIRFIKSTDDSKPYEVFLARNFSVRKNARRVFQLLRKFF